jgi:hypothetical protein
MSPQPPFDEAILMELRSVNSARGGSGLRRSRQPIDPDAEEEEA